jgi:PAS domain-containing protein
MVLIRKKHSPSLEEYLARVHPHDREFMASLIKRMLAEGSGCDVTKRIVRPDGELRHIRCVGAPVVEGGTLKGIVGSAIDVTEHEVLTQELRRADGTYHWFLYRGLPLRDDGGNVVKWYGTVTNIDALKETESALRTREHEFVGIIETIPSMLWSLWPTGEPAHLSKRFLLIFWGSVRRIR